MPDSCSLWQPETSCKHLDNYQVTRRHDAGFIILLNDLWGFDATQNSPAPTPGDDDDWSF